jgi:nucleotide-binding universal stress UspA family protein
MPTAKRLRVLVAIDGSPAAQAAVDTVVQFPWPDTVRVRGVVALRAGYFQLQSKQLDEALENSLRDAADAAREVLASRWHGADVAVVNKAPLDGILGEARRTHADIIALGWRGHGTFRRLLAGSISRDVAARANCSILVARTAPASVNRFLIGYDGDPNARRAVSLLSRMEPGRGNRAVLVKVIEPVGRLPARAARLPASVRATIRSEIAARNAKRREEAQAALEAAAARLKSIGWNTETEVRSGSPLPTLLSAAHAHRADVLVVGAREAGGVKRALLGSVAEGILNSSRTPVLLVR